MKSRSTMPLLLVMLATLSWSSGDAEARKRWPQYSTQEPLQERSSRAPEAPKPNSSSVTEGRLSAIMAQLVRGCLQQASELQNWPFDGIRRIAAPNDGQAKQLDILRAAAAQSAQRLSAECPPQVPPPAKRLDAVLRSIDAADAAFETIEPALRSFYGALDDEQKGRLLRDFTFSPNAQASDRDLQQLVERRRAAAPGRSERTGNGDPWAGICEQLTAALGDWPTSEIERRVRLTGAQRIGFYEFVIASLRAAEALAGTCNREAAITPVHRMVSLRERLTSVRESLVAIHVAQSRFFQSLDENQQASFAGIK